MSKISGFSGAPFHWGTRETVRVLIWLLREYQKHRATIALDVDPKVVAALDALVELADLILTINPPGPR